MLHQLSLREDVVETSSVALTELSDVLYRLLSSGRLDASKDLLKIAESIGL